MKRFLLFLLLTVRCLAQNDPLTQFAPFMMQSQLSTPYSPTNLPGGYSAFVWYEPHLGYATNGGIATLSNLAPTGAIFDLTNGTAASMPIRVPGGLNGFDTLSFRNAQHITCNIWTNWSPWEVFVVLAWTNTTDGTIIGSAKTGPIGAEVWHFRSLSSDRQFRAQQGGANPALAGVITNKYFVADVLYDGANTTIYTNNVQGSNGNVGTIEVAIGLKIGARYDNAILAEMSVASIFAFTNQLLNAAARSNAFFYCTNRFAIAP